MDETKARDLADKLSITAPDDDLVPWINLLLDFETEVRREALMEAVAAISAEDMFDETDDPTDAAYSRAIRDCKDAIRALSPQAGPDPTVALAEISAERRRQIEIEGWTPDHDDAYTQFELAWAAACYTEQAGMGDKLTDPPLFPVAWPWAQKWWKPSTPRRDLIKAGALIVAEIERLDRAADRVQAPVAAHEAAEKPDFPPWSREMAALFRKTTAVVADLSRINKLPSAARDLDEMWDAAFPETPDAG